MEYFADGYSEKAFDGILVRFQAGSTISKPEVLLALGTPLATGHQQIIPSRSRSEGWLYSYMPSCGYGWRTRMLYFNGNDILVDYLVMNEPRSHSAYNNRHDAEAQPRRSVIV